MNDLQRIAQMAAEQEPDLPELYFHEDEVCAELEDDLLVKSTLSNEKELVAVGFQQSDGYEFFVIKEKEFSILAYVLSCYIFARSA